MEISYQHYGRIASKYDLLAEIADYNSNYLFDLVDQRKNFFDLEFASKRKLRLLDLGCGTGLASQKFSFYENIEIYGIDISPAMIEKFLQKGFSFQGICLDLARERIPFENNFFDIIISNGLFPLIERPKHLLEEVFRILKRGGLLAFNFEKQENLESLPIVRSGVLIWKHQPKIFFSFFREKNMTLIDYKTAKAFGRWNGETIFFTNVLTQKN